HVDPRSAPAVGSCGVPVGAFVPGPGPWRGGVLAWNHDRGLVAPGVERFVPSCLFESAGRIDSAARWPIGSVQQVRVSTFFPRSFALLVGPSALLRVRPVQNPALVDYRAPAYGLLAAATIGPGLAAAVPLQVPADPNLIGAQLAVQALLGPA